MERPSPPPIEIDSTTAFFWEGTRAGELRILRCQSCGMYIHLPRPICRRCHSFDLAPNRVSGRGTLYSFTQTFKAFHPYFVDQVPYLLATVTLAEQPGLHCSPIWSGSTKPMFASAWSSRCASRTRRRARDPGLHPRRGAERRVSRRGRHRRRRLLRRRPQHRTQRASPRRPGRRPGPRRRRADRQGHRRRVHLGRRRHRLRLDDRVRAAQLEPQRRRLPRVHHTRVPRGDGRRERPCRHGDGVPDHDAAAAERRARRRRRDARQHRARPTPSSSTRTATSPPPSGPV